MALNDFQKKRYKLVPGADYDTGPISKYGTFGNMMRVKMGERNKQIADQLDKPDAALDFINPMSGMIKTVGRKMSAAAAKSLTRALNNGASEGSYRYVQKLPKEVRQEVTDELFNSRKIEEAKGLTGNQSPGDVDYFGFTTQMPPLNFLKLANKRSDTYSDKTKRKDFAYNIARKMGTGKEPKLGPPKLWGDLKEGKLYIDGHEGRHRSDAVYELLGNDVSMPVDFQIKKNGSEYRRRSMDDEVLDVPIINQDGQALKSTLRDLLPEGFDTSALKAAPKVLSEADRATLMTWGEGGNYTWKDTLHEEELIKVLEKQPKMNVGNVVRHGDIGLDFGNFKIGDTLTTDRLLSAEKKGGNYQGRHESSGRTIIDTQEGGVYDFENYQLPSATLEKEVIIPKGSRLSVTDFTPKGTTKTREFIPGFSEEYVTREDILRLRLLKNELTN